MVNGITSSAASYASASAQVASVQAIQPSVAGQTAANAAPEPDSVTLSAPAQAHAMQQQGMEVKTIAANMGTTTQTVNGYLGITSISSGASSTGGMALIANVAAHVRVHLPPALLNSSSAAPVAKPAQH